MEQVVQVVLMGLQGQVDLREHLELVVVQELMVHLVQQEPLEPLEHLEHLEHLDLVGLQGQQELVVLQVLVGHLELQE